MGTGTVVGILMALAGVFLSMILEGGNPGALLAPPAIILILFGSFGAATAGVRLDAALDALKAFALALKSHNNDVEGILDRLGGYAEVARREGALALEAGIPAEPDEFLRGGLQLMVDGTSSNEIREQLMVELHASRKAWKSRADFYSKMGGYSPTFGIIGTVLGLIHTLEGLSGDPAELGELIAAAFIATFFGVTFANAVFLPVGTKLANIGAEEAETRLLVIEGLCAIADGRSPRHVEETLLRYLRPAERESLRRSA